MSGPVAVIFGVWGFVYLAATNAMSALAITDSNGIALSASALSFAGAIIVALIQSRTKGTETAKFVMEELRRVETTTLDQARQLAIAQADAARLLVELARERGSGGATQETKAAVDVADATVRKLTAQQAANEAGKRVVEANPKDRAGAEALAEAARADVDAETVNTEAATTDQTEAESKANASAEDPKETK